MTGARLTHLLAGLLVWGAFVAWRGRRAGGPGRARTRGTSVPRDPDAPDDARRRADLALLPGVVVGAAVPDWDLWVGGVGFHRSPLFHSALPVLVLGGLGRLISRRTVPWWPGGLALGVASHLLWDIVQYGDVRWIRGGNADRLWLLVNAATLLTWAAWRLRDRPGPVSTPDP